MNDKPKNPLSGFDDFLQNSPFQMMKLMLPFLSASNQKTLLILIKFMEFKSAMDYFRQGHKLDICSMENGNASPMDKIAAIKDFLPPKEQESIDNMMNMMSAMELFQGMSEDGSFPFPFSMEACQSGDSDSEDSRESKVPENSEKSEYSKTSRDFEDSENSRDSEDSRDFEDSENFRDSDDSKLCGPSEPSEEEKPKTVSICSNIDF